MNCASIGWISFFEGKPPLCFSGIPPVYDGQEGVKSDADESCRSWFSAQVLRNFTAAAALDACNDQSGPFNSIKCPIRVWKNFGIGCNAFDPEHNDDDYSVENM